MLSFNKLRLSGFKSFVDGAVMLIEPGLTGIVGPNGCGKSNLVEALRWVMGETSAKRMRGNGMDDVIFAGATGRAARNIAEVILNLDNSQRTAPAHFNDSDELEICRRIEREKGSQYQINGQEVRAKDVQLLFADTATGARSTALVSQGSISAIIADKPMERRKLLEEAAGITGLHSRRHEAELRLGGAETNLERLDDVLDTLDVQIGSLKKQARQATRYRNISDHIRKAEATFYHLRWLAAESGLADARREMEEAEAIVAELTRQAAGKTARQAEAAALLPELRQREAAAAAELQRLLMARDGLDAEEQRVDKASRECRARLQQITADRQREETLAADAEAARRRLAEESRDIHSAAEGGIDACNEAAEKLSRAKAESEALEKRTNALTARIAADAARRTGLQAAIDEQKDRRLRLSARAHEISQDRAALEAETGGEEALDAVAGAMERAREALNAARRVAESTEAARQGATEESAHASKARDDSRALSTNLEAEEKALSEVLELADADIWPPLIDAVQVEPGYETALGAALGDDLNAPADEQAKIHWRTLEPLASPPPLPSIAEPLSRYVSGPEALDRRLLQVGLVADEETGNRLAAELNQGQRLVSRDGALWRWDGFTVGTDAPTAAAARLKQMRRLREVRNLLTGAGAALTAAEETAATARKKLGQAETAEHAARNALRQADADYARARDARTEAKERTAAGISRLKALKETAESLSADLEEADAKAGRAAAELATLPDPALCAGEMDELRRRLDVSRDALTERWTENHLLIRAAGERQRRLEDIEGELATWGNRANDAARQLQQLDDRRRRASANLARLADAPAEIAGKRSRLLNLVEDAEKVRFEAADALAGAENREREAAKALREAESDLAAGREQRIRAEGLVEQARQACNDVAERVRDKLDCGTEDLFAVAGLKEGKELPELEAVERRVERLHRERDTMGPVNLRAEQEMRELAEQVDTMRSERDDLIKAVEKLRQGISQLNREGRQRLLASFEKVDQCFQDLFVRLFGGGQAYLQLTESDDPLEAGLEIMARPPGKKLQMLSLLSGGEQALTALALLFSVFLTNPAPICVLDEVDAPLDDANVDRLCTLIDEIAHTGGTRFIVATHHRMTMARMDRLFGVTMPERGVSQLVSVDLRKAEYLHDIA
jgi:chromosome segregation protein